MRSAACVVGLLVAAAGLFAAAPARGQGVPPEGVLVRLAPTAAQHYTIAVQSATGVQMCLAPCNLRMPPGPARLSVSGDGRIERDIVVPAAAAAVVRVAHPERGWRIAGAVVGLAVGPGFLIAGLLDPSTPLGVVSLVAGVALVASGVVNLVLAVTMQPTVDVRALAARRPVAPRLVAGPAGLAWAF